HRVSGSPPGEGPAPPRHGRLGGGTRTGGGIVTGPLAGVRIIELSGLGPTPYGVMLLADLGAEVIRVDRVAAAQGKPGTEVTNIGMSRNRRSIAIDLKSPAGLQVLLELVDTADVLVEGF